MRTWEATMILNCRLFFLLLPFLPLHLHNIYIFQVAMLRLDPQVNFHIVCLYSFFEWQSLWPHLSSSFEWMNEIHAKENNNIVRSWLFVSKMHCHYKVKPTHIYYSRVLSYCHSYCCWCCCWCHPFTRESLCNREMIDDTFYDTNNMHCLKWRYNLIYIRLKMRKKWDFHLLLTLWVRRFIVRSNGK